MTVTFCGHGQIFANDEVRDWVRRIILDLLKDGATLFYSGGYGQFDAIVARVLKELKDGYPQLESVLVLAYLDKKVDTTLFDDTTYPPLETVPRRYAILKRNRWMVEQSDIVVAYVTHGWGGAAQTLEYAQKKKKRIIQFQKSDAI